jgi:hypothetical protein
MDDQLKIKGWPDELREKLHSAYGGAIEALINEEKTVELSRIARFSKTKFQLLKGPQTRNDNL